MLKIEEKNGGITFRIRVRPSASRNKNLLRRTLFSSLRSENKIKGFYGGALKIDINAPPMRSKANKECVRFLAKELKISKSNIEIISGLKSRDKLVKIKGISKEKVLKALCSKS